MEFRNYYSEIDGFRKHIIMYFATKTKIEKFDTMISPPNIHEILLHLSKNDPNDISCRFAMKYNLQLVREELVLVSDALDKSLQSLPQVT
jgi:hypothetical protein